MHTFFLEGKRHGYFKNVMHEKEFEDLMVALYHDNQLFIPQGYELREWINALYKKHKTRINFGNFSNGRLTVWEERVDWVMDDGEKFPVIWRKKGNLKCDPCPYCGVKHRHGDGEGHRLSHCRERYMDGDEVFILDNGKPHFDNGYILKEYKSIVDKVRQQHKMEDALK